MRFNRILYVAGGVVEFSQSPPPQAGRNGAAPRSGISNETGLLQEWPTEGPKLLWQKDGLGNGYSTPSVVGDRIYLISNKGLEDEFVQCLSTEDGSQLWQTQIGKVGKPDQKPPYPCAPSTPTIDGDMLYALGSDGDLVCMAREGRRSPGRRTCGRFRRRVRHSGRTPSRH